MKKLLIVVDYQIDFVNGTLGFENADKLDEAIYNKILNYKENNYDVIYTFDTHYENYFNTIEGSYLPVKHCILGSNGHNLYGKVATLFDKSKDVYFEKETFPSLNMANYLATKDYDEVTLCGLVSNICVFSNAIMVKASLPNAKIIIERSLTDSFDKNLQEKSYDVLKGLHIEVI